MTIKGIIFDMDGLIFDTEMVYCQAAQTTAEKLGIPYTKDTYMDFLGVSDEEVWAGYHEMFDESHGVEVVDQFIRDSFNEGIRLFETGEGKLKPGVWELLKYLDEEKIPRVVASSNMRHVIDILLEKNDLVPEFQTIVSVEDVQRAKPDPEIFEVAQQRLGLPKENLLILEDSNNGILAANGAGIDVLMVPDLLQPDQELRNKTVAVLDSLVEVPAYIEAQKD